VRKSKKEIRHLEKVKNNTVIVTYPNHSKKLYDGLLPPWIHPDDSEEFYLREIYNMSLLVPFGN